LGLSDAVLKIERLACSVRILVHGLVRYADTTALEKVKIQHQGKRTIAIKAGKGPKRLRQNINVPALFY
jgi:hypothetical protein